MYNPAMQLMVWNPWASGLSVSGAGSSGSGWQASSNNSFAVFAVYDTEDGDLDFMGVSRYSAEGSSYSSGITLTATRTVTITWQPAARRPNHYSIFYQAASSWNTANTATKIGEVDGDTTSISILSPVSQGTLPAGHDVATTITLDPVINIIASGRQLVQRAAGGELVRVSTCHYPISMPNGNDTIEPEDDSITIEVARMATNMAAWKTLRKWMRYGLPVILIDPNTDSDVDIKYWYGRITAIPFRSSNGRYQTQQGRCSVTLAVEGICLA